MASQAVRKVVVTHRAAARAKYGAAGWARITAAVTALRRADAARGITTRLVALDSAADARRVGATPVADVHDPQATKAFLDAVDGHDTPAYLLLLGGPELVATVPLVNPLWTGTPDGDPDRTIASDLPYACDVAYSTSPSAFTGPTRVVGRVPDLVGVADPGVLVAQLTAAAGAGPAPAPSAVFALSTKTWQASTRLSVSRLPVAGSPTHTCPVDGPGWTRADLAPPVHFVNCHGGEFDPRWYGEATGRATLPVAVDGATLLPLVAPGTVVAVECCYGAAHWAPAQAAGAISVAMTYLAAGAAGVFGASTTAYGPTSGNEYADVIARLFAADVMAGASLGRAALAARQGFVAAEAFLDPTSLVTLVQFTLLGDPSVHPFAAPAGAGPRPKTLRSATVGPAAVPAGVRDRRAVLRGVGAALRASTTATGDRPTTTRRPGRPPAGYDVDPATVRVFAAARSPDPERRAASATVGLLRGARTGTGRTMVVTRDRPGAGSEVRVVVPK